MENSCNQILNKKGVILVLHSTMLIWFGLDCLMTILLADIAIFHRAWFKIFPTVCSETVINSRETLYINHLKSKTKVSNLIKQFCHTTTHRPPQMKRPFFFLSDSKQNSYILTTSKLRPFLPNQIQHLARCQTSNQRAPKLKRSAIYRPHLIL